MSFSLQQAIQKDGKEYFSEDPNHFTNFEKELRTIIKSFSNDDLSKGISGLNELERNIFHCSLMVHTDYKDVVNENTLSNIPRDDLAMVFLKMSPSIFNKFVSSISSN
jgi:hypothetical protein